MNHMAKDIGEAMGLAPGRDRKIVDSIIDRVEKGGATTARLFEFVEENYEGLEQVYGIFYVGFLWRLHKEVDVNEV